MSSIVVGVRVRPFNQREVKYNSRNIVIMETGMVKLVVVRQGKVAEKEAPKEYAFDHMLWTFDDSQEPYADQAYVYDKMGRHILQNVLEGYNACLFAYGQTGSGKTYSMVGYGSQPGIVPRLCADLFGQTAKIHQASTESSKTLCIVDCSYLEIYNEVVKDLLNPADSKEGLRIRQHPKTGVFVEGLKKTSVSTEEQILKVLDVGAENRATAATLMNATSSRSHALLLIVMTQTTTTTATSPDGTTLTTEAVKAGKLSLVDLAGSERASSTGASGDTLTEGANINRSLTFLGMCLSRLADIADGKTGLHVPYRDSSLTFLLSESLGGNSKTSMLAGISPAEINFDETLSTLRFASVVKKVKNHAVVNESATTKLIRELRDELKALKAQLAKYESGSAAPKKPVTESPPPNPSTVDVPAPCPQQAPVNDERAAEPRETTADAPEKEAARPDEAPANKEAAEVNEAVETKKPTEELNEATKGEEPEPTDELARTRVLSPDEIDSLRQRLAENEAAARQLECDLEESSAPTEAEDENIEIVMESRSRQGVVFVDWRRPQLVNLCPEGTILVLHVRDGQNVFTIEEIGNPATSIRCSDPSRGHRGDDADEAAVNTSSSLATGKVSFSIDFLPLTNTATFSFVTRSTVSKSTEVAAEEQLVDTTPSPVAETLQNVLPFVNGETVEVADAATTKANGQQGDVSTTRTYRCALSHSDRLVFAGTVAFRFAHSAGLPTMPAFSAIPNPKSHDPFLHIHLLEVLRRQQRVTIPYYAGLQKIRRMWNDAVGAWPPESRQQLLLLGESLSEEIDTDAVEAQAAMRRAEDELITDFPISLPEQQKLMKKWRATQKSGAKQRSLSMTGAEVELSAMVDSEAWASTPRDNETDAEGDATEENDYEAVVEEQRRALKEKEALVESLRGEVRKAQINRRERQQSMIRRKDEVARKAREDAAEVVAVSKAVEEELKWHTTVKKLRVLKKGGPTDAKDKEIWLSLGGPLSQMPFLSEIMALIRIGSMPSDPRQQTVNMPTRVMAGELFKQSKSKQTKWESRYGVICNRFLYYFPRCDGRERAMGGIYLYGATVMQIKTEPRPWCFLLTSPCPRRGANDTNTFTCALNTEKEMNSWIEWIKVVSAPPIPATMALRLRETQEAQAEDEEGVLSATLGGRAHWKPTSTVQNCEACNAQFGLFRWKNNCFSCGGVFCSDCAPKTKDSAGNEIRMCKSCKDGKTVEISLTATYDVVDPSS